MEVIYRGHEDEFESLDDHVITIPGVLLVYDPKGREDSFSGRPLENNARKTRSEVIVVNKGTLTISGGKPTTPTRIPGTVLTRDIYEPGFLYPNPGVCPNDGQDTRLLILIASAPNHFSARDAIRLTWGHFAQRLDVNYAFIIGE